MILIGLTGGIGAGKSTVAARLAHHGAVVIDADQIARDVVTPGRPALNAIVHAFGNDMLHADGSLDRAALASVVFAHHQKLTALNAIMHPQIRAEVAERIAAAPDDSVVVYEVPLLVEAAVDHPFDYIVVVEASRANRLNRLVKQRSMSKAAALSRIAAQTDDEERRAIADWIVNTDGSLPETTRQVDEFWSTLRSR